MTSPLLALFERSLREDARLKMTYAARAGLVLVVSVFMIFTVVASGWRGAPGLNFFTAIVHIQTVFITLAGLSYFASAITEEKEENMLGLLRMTELNPLSILLGKSTSRLCGALLLLVAQFPFTLLAVTLGGVTARQIVAAYLALGAYTFFLCNFALLASVVARRTGHAAAVIGVALGSLWFAASVSTQVASVLFPHAGWAIFRWVADGLNAVSTSAQLEEVLDTGFDGALLGWQFVFNLGAGLLFFGAAWLVFERAGERDSAESAASPSTWLRRRLPAGRVWPRALVWKDACFMHGGRGMSVLKLAGYGAALAAFFAHRWMSGALSSPAAMSGTVFAASGIALIVLLLELGIVASRIYRIEVQDGTFSILVLLPLSIPELHQAKLQSSYHAVMPAAVWTVLIYIGGMVASVFLDGGGIVMGVTLMLGVGFFLVAPQIMLYFNLVAWLSLQTPRGALPLAIVALLLGNFVAGFAGTLLFGIGFIAIPFIAVMLAGYYRGKLLARLEEIAGEG